MSLTQSTMLELGTIAPDFRLTDVVAGESVSLSDFSGKGSLLVMFICAHCPYVVHVEEELAKIGKDYLSKDIAIIAISSNDPSYDTSDAPSGLKKQSERLDLSFPYLFDEDQSVAQAYRAVCTPDLFLFDKDRKLAYRGQLDSSRPGNGVPVTGEDIRAAMDAFLSGSEVDKNQKPSAGCNIKWR
jgi:peroxiredoxin